MILSVATITECKWTIEADNVVSIEISDVLMPNKRVFVINMKDSFEKILIPYEMVEVIRYTEDK